MTEILTESQLRLGTSHLNIYSDLVNEEKLFNSFYHLFSFALVYGILHGKKEDPKTRTTFVPILIIDKHVQELLEICYLLLNDGRSMKEIYEDMMAYADAGVIEVNEIYKKNKSFILTNLINDSKKLWQERVKNLQNINLEKSK